MATTVLAGIPPLGRLYAKAFAGGALPQGRRSGTLPDTTLVVRDVRVDYDHLASYARVCGFRLRDRLPANYVHVLAFPVSMALMTDTAFPFPLPGLVHVANRIDLRAPLTATDRLDLAVSAADLRPHAKGRQLDIRAEARRDGEIVWTGVSTYLRRGGGGDEDAPELELSLTPPAPEFEPLALWQLPADTGRRYAKVSGDRNPIHLTPFTSRLFGFPRPIAHGMWTAARCEATLEDQLPDAVTHTIRFGRPLPLPGRATFTAAEHVGGWSFAVRDPKTGAPHLTGTTT